MTTRDTTGWPVHKCEEQPEPDCKNGHQFPPIGTTVAVLADETTRQVGDDSETPVTIKAGTVGLVEGFVTEWHHVHVSIVDSTPREVVATELKPFDQVEVDEDDWHTVPEDGITHDYFIVREVRFTSMEGCDLTFMDTQMVTRRHPLDVWIDPDNLTNATSVHTEEKA